ncbi:MAG TPA: SPW repeat protein [Thermomonospora sp.]|nr:SPW repeat protein [Thermomonospora sp.]
MATHARHIESHPDIAALRERYDVAAEKPVSQAVDGLIALTGLWLAISPWVVGFEGMTNLAVNNLITGIALALLAVGFASAFGRTHGMTWIAPVIGVWTIIAPWIVDGGQDTTSTIWNNVVTGALIVILGAAAMAMTAMRR